MAEQDRINPALQDAIDRGMPQTYPLNEVADWMYGRKTHDELGVLSLGFRYSPEAMRAMTLMLCNGFYDEDGYHGPPNQQFRISTAAYAYFNDFISRDEFGTLISGKAIYGHMPQSEGELWSGPQRRGMSNSLHPTIEEVAVILDERRRENPDLKVVMFNGKFNGVPHPGHIMLFRDTANDLHFEEGIDYENMVFVCACESNNYIRSAGKEPFLNTAWRMSLMSYLPYIDYVCASGNYNLVDGQRHWTYKTQILWPDYVPVERDHPLYDLKVRQAMAAGAKIIEHGRTTGEVNFGDRLQPSDDSKFGPVISSSHLQTGTVASGEIGGEYDYRFFNPIAHLMAMKEIRDQLYDPRDWFRSKRILLPSDLGRLSESPFPQILRP